jgi:16S rRNA (uracil1498-N3)-methyltransferase
MPNYFITSSQIQGESIRIVGPLLKHLKDALRIKQGEPLTFVDERQQRYLVQVDRISHHLLVARIIDRLAQAPAPLLQLHLAQGIIKGKKMDWIIQKATELGVSQMIPLLTSRTVVRLEGLRARRQQERWQAIANEAAQQSGRDKVPSIQAVCSFSDFIRSAGHQLLLLLWEEEARQSLKNELSSQKEVKSATLLIGPEGGFSQKEVTEAKARGFQTVHLGRRILRTETAGLATLSILQYLWGDLGT